MEVTRSNFASVVDEMLEAINSSTFIGVDGEFTGLCARKRSTINNLDTPRMRYHKLRSDDKSVDFLLLQVGLCTFHHDPATGEFVARPFNVYLFPRPLPYELVGRDASTPDAVFRCQASSVEFLISQDFDFNKTFKNGIGYLSLAEHQRLKEDLLQKEKDQLLLEVAQRERKSSCASTPGTPSNTHRPSTPSSTTSTPSSSTVDNQIEIPPEQKSFMEDVVKKVEEFLDDASRLSLAFPPSNAFQRKLVFQLVTGSKYSAALLAESRLNDKGFRFVHLTKADEEAKKKLAEEKAKEKWRLVEDALGFTKVIKALADSGKIIVGHNMLQDLLHLVHHFVYPGLPEDYDDFKELLHGKFPNIVDTKVMALQLPFRELIADNALGKEGWESWDGIGT